MEKKLFDRLFESVSQMNEIAAGSVRRRASLNRRGPGEGTRHATGLPGQVRHADDVQLATLRNWGKADANLPAPQRRSCGPFKRSEAR